MIFISDLKPSCGDLIKYDNDMFIYLFYDVAHVMYEVQINEIVRMNGCFYESRMIFRYPHEINCFKSCK